MEYLPSPLFYLERLIEPSPNIFPVIVCNVRLGIELKIGTPTIDKYLISSPY